jgi:hypothetical protein
MPQDRGNMGRRITFRIDDQQFEQIQEKCRKTDLDASFVIRQALDLYFSGANVTDAQAPPTNPGSAMPPEAFALEGPFRAWSGDLRTELRKRLKETLALSHATAEQYPKTKGVREAYMSVLEAFNQLNGGRQ